MLFGINSSNSLHTEAIEIDIGINSLAILSANF
jgi:hypothetical protein